MKFNKYAIAAKGKPSRKPGKAIKPIDKVEPGMPQEPVKKSSSSMPSAFMRGK